MLDHLKFKISRFLSRNEAVVLMYHGVTSFRYRFPVWTQLDTDSFDGQMCFLRDKGFNLCHLSDLVSHVDKHNKIPRNCVVVTFDDGFRNNYHEALPVLEKYSIPATVFITAKLIGTSELIWSDLLIYAFSETQASKLTHDEVGSYSLTTLDEVSTSLRSIVRILKTVPAEKKDRIVSDIVQALLPDGIDHSSPLYDSLKLMSWSELTELSRSKFIQIGGHTCTHNILTRLSREAAQAEIESCKSVLEDKLENQVDVFAYPNGTRNDFSAQDVDLLSSGGWQSAVTTEENRVTVPFDRYRIPRLGIGAETSLSDFSYILSGRSHRNSSSLATLPLRIVKGVVAGRY